MQLAVPWGGTVDFVDGDGEVKHVGNTGAQWLYDRVNAIDDPERYEDEFRLFVDRRERGLPGNAMLQGTSFIALQFFS